MQTGTEFTEDESTLNNRIAVVGLACRFPGAADAEQFWANLRNGVESIRIMNRDELKALGVPAAQTEQANFVPASAFVHGIEDFDAAFFGLSPREAELMDPQHRLFLECAWEALEASGHGGDAGRRMVGVFAGAGINTYLLHHLMPRLAGPKGLNLSQALLTNVNDFLATRTSYSLNLAGPSINVQTACSTSLVGIHLACQSLLLGECDVALAGGATITLPRRPGYPYQEGGIDSRDGHCRAFDRDATGTVAASGVGVVALKHLDAALADGNDIYAVIRGSAVTNDGSAKVGFTAPGTSGQTAAITSALAVSGVSADDISFVEAHGTGTRLGDPVEIKALTDAYRRSTTRKGYCAIGSVKTNVGHMDTAAGVAGFIKVVQSLRHGEVPPTLNYAHPNPEIGLEQTPFFVNTALRPLPSDRSHLAAVSSFGIGGTNVHCILEQHRSAAPTPPTLARPQVIPLSAKSEASLQTYKTKLREFLCARPSSDVSSLAHTLQVRRKAFDVRHAIVAANSTELVKALEQPIATGSRKAEPPVPVFLFPGQGSQHHGMARTLYGSVPVFRQELDACVAVLQGEGVDVPALIWGAAPNPALDETRVAQPVLFAIEYSLARTLMAAGVNPVAMLGHSLGEYVAATLSGVLGRDDALRLVALRGRLMQQAPPGAMLAVRLAAEEVAKLLGPDLEIAAQNAPNSSVVAGPVAAIEALAAELQRRAVPAQRLRTSHAFHSRLMEPILDPFRKAWARLELHDPQIPYLSNVTGTWITAEQAKDPGYWAEHLRRAVRFGDGFAELVRGGNQLVLEVGPGTALKTLAARLLPAESGSRFVTLLPHASDQVSDETCFKRALATIWAAGVAVDWRTFWAGEPPPAMSLPSYAFDRKRFWIEPPTAAEVVNRSVGAVTTSEVGQWVSLHSWRLSPEQRARIAAPPAEATWLIFGDGPLAQAAGERCRRAEIPLIRVRPGTGFAASGDREYTLDPAADADYASLFRELDSLGAVPSRVVFCAEFEPGVAQQDPFDRFAAGVHRAGLPLIGLARAFTAKYPARELEIVGLTCGLNRIVGDEAGPPEAAALLGLLRVLPQELSGLSCFHLDVDAAFTDLREAGDGLAHPYHWLGSGRHPVVALRHGRRWVPTQMPPVLAPGGDAPGRTPALKPGGRYLITGGMGAIGLAIAEHLAAEFQATVVVTSRQPADTAERSERFRRVRQKLNERTAAGAIHVRCADVTSRSAMESLLISFETEFGPLDGVIHAAGLTGEQAHRPVDRLDPATLDEICRAKILGAHVLLDLLAMRSLDFLVFCSSLSSLLGGTGFAGYAGANAVLDTLAQNLQGVSHTPVLTINWDGWSQVDPVPGAPDYGLIPPSEGARAFVQALRFTDQPEVYVSRTDLARRVERSKAANRRESATNAVPAITRHARPDLPTPFLEPSTPAELTIAEIWRDAMGLDQVGVNDNFFDLGGDSLVGVNVVTKIRKALNFDLQASQLFEAPTVAALARLVEGRQEEKSLDESEERGRRRKQQRRERRVEATADEAEAVSLQN